MSLITRIIMGIVLVGGVSTAGYFVLKAPQETNVTTISKQENIHVEHGKKVPFAQFVKQGGTYKCSVSQVVENIESKGTVYVSGELLRGDFTTNVQKMTIHSTLIVRDGYTYTWTSASPSMGFKAKVVPPKEGVVNTSTSGSYAWNSELVGDYSCETWTLDEAKFKLPTTVTFTSVN